MIGWSDGGWLRGLVTVGEYASSSFSKGLRDVRGTLWAPSCYGILQVEHEPTGRIQVSVAPVLDLAPASGDRCRG